MSNRIVFLDFDGVLFDTVKEAYAITVISTLEYTCLEEIDYSSHNFFVFNKFRYLVNSAWNYKYIIKLINCNTNIDSFEDSYIQLISNASPSDYQHFEYNFFEVRKDIQLNSYSKWLTLNEPYNFLNLVAPIANLHVDSFIIVTTKNMDSVIDLISKSKLTNARIKIYGRRHYEKYNGKSNIIKKVMTEKNTSNAIFIDDNNNHLNLCENINNLKLLQANWGYKSPKDTNTHSEKSAANIIKNFVGYQC